MAARRSASGGGERPRKHRPKLGHDTLSELKNSYVRENLRSRKVAPMFADLRGNAVSVHSTGHIHHPCRLSTHWKWARLVELLLEPLGNAGCCGVVSKQIRNHPVEYGQRVRLAGNFLRAVFMDSRLPKSANNDANASTQL